MGAPFPQHCLFLWGIWTPSNTWFPGPTRVLNPNSISIGSAIFAALTSVTDRLQSSNWTSDLFSTYSYIFNVNYACWHLIISRIRGLAPLKISLIIKYRHRIDIQYIQWNRSAGTSPGRECLFHRGRYCSNVTVKKIERFSRN